jgi:hypothetical protein
MVVHNAGSIYNSSVGGVSSNNNSSNTTQYNNCSILIHIIELKNEI